MDETQSSFLARRLAEAIRQQPEILALRNRLLALGGLELVAPPFVDADIKAIIEAGELTTGVIVAKNMEMSNCHENVAKLWLDRRSRLTAIATGYALSGDGLWRQHSWGIRRRSIVETTAPRVKYFGIVLKGTRANLFAAANLGSQSDLLAPFLRAQIGPFDAIP
jgi:hypothetical protein